MGRVGGIRHSRPTRLPAFTPVIGGVPSLQSLSLVQLDASRALYAPTLFPGYDVAPGGTAEFTGAASPTDTSSAWASFLSAHPNENIALVPGRTYRMDSSTQLSNHDGWDLYAQGATITCNVLGSGNQAWLRMITSDNWRIRDLNLVGPASHQDIVDNYSNYGWSREDWRGFIIDGGHNVRMDRVKIHGFWGDPLYIAPRGNSGDQYDTPDGIILDHCQFWDAGRNAVSMVGGHNVTVTDCEIGNGGLSAWDTEPNNSGDVTDHVTFTRCYFYGGDLGGAGAASHDSYGNGYVVYASAGFAPFVDYEFANCHFDIGAVYVRRESGTHNDQFSMTGCTADANGDVTFQLTDNVTFSGNSATLHRVNL